MIYFSSDIILFNTTVAELRRLNNLTSDTLQVGQVLIINDVTTPAPDDNFITYVVFPNL